MKTQDANRLNAFEHRCLRSILRISYTQYNSNADFRVRCKITEPLDNKIREQRLRWLGHTLRAYLLTALFISLWCLNQPLDGNVREVKHCHGTRQCILTSYHSGVTTSMVEDTGRRTGDSLCFHWQQIGSSGEGWWGTWRIPTRTINF